VRIAIALLLALTVPATAGERLVGRAHVTDGDTLRVGGVAVRLKGLAAPEVAHFGDPAEPGGEAAKAFMVELVEGQTVVCDLTNERTHGRRVGYCYRDSADIAEALVRAGLARDCPRFSGGRYAAAEQASAATLSFPSYCVPR
jgi:endonuclease YncB( thermonuclease family)